MNKCIVLYEGWQLECCGEDFSTKSSIKWLVCNNAKIRLPIKIDNIDYYYEAHSSDYKNLFVLEGKVNKIQALFQKKEPLETNPEILVPKDGTLIDINSSIETLKINNEMEFFAYIVEIEDYSIRPAKQEDVTYKDNIS